MKKQLSILWCISALMLCACGNSKPQSKDNIVNKDSLTTNDTKESFIVTKDGVGSLRNNKPFTDMSQTMMLYIIRLRKHHSMMSQAE